MIEWQAELRCQPVSKLFVLRGIVWRPGQTRPREDNLGCTEEALVPGEPAGVVARATGWAVVVGAVEEASRVSCADVVNGAFAVVDERDIERLLAC